MNEIVPESNELSLEDVLNEIRDFGIEENEEIITITSGTKVLNLRIKNTNTDDELLALAACEEYKGHAWIQKIRCEIITRSISSINGIKIEPTTYVYDPVSRDEVQARIAIRSVIASWGLEFTHIVWKVIMTHRQKIEDRLLVQFKDTDVFTEVERRLVERALKEIDENSNQVLTETIQEVADDAAKTTEQP